MALEHTVLNRRSRTLPALTALIFCFGAAPLEAQDRACCTPSGTCLGDANRTCCQTGLEADGMTPCASPFDIGGNTWHVEASCTGAASLPPPVCNPYDVNDCAWDNGLPLNDGGASRAHTHPGGVGQSPQYDFNTADDFTLKGPSGDSAFCAVSLVTAYLRARPADTTGPEFTPPNLPVDAIGINLTVFANWVAPNTGLDSPAGVGELPLNAQDLNPKGASLPGGIVYARTFCTGTLAAEPGICPDPPGAVTMTLLPGYCDPPPAVGFESEAVYQVDIFVDPPILLNKNVTYWLDVQGVFPFNDGLRDTLQTWWMPAQNNTGLRGMTQRTGNNDYMVGGLPAWVPVNIDLVPGGSPPQRGNSGNVAPCAGVAPNTRVDYAFRLSGAKDAPGASNDVCADAVPAFDGVTSVDTIGASMDGPNPASCGTIDPDVWFTYTATCTGVATVSTCGSEQDSILAIYEGAACPSEPRTAEGGAWGDESRGLELACNNDSDSCAPGSDDAYVQVVVAAGAEYLIRVGSVGPAAGLGLLSIECRDSCGSTTAGDCCSAHGPAVGCLNAICCETICSTPGYEYCCADWVIGWDAGCAEAAAQSPVCGCPCALNCPGGSIFESEPCSGPESNLGCSKTFPPAGGFESATDLWPGTTIHKCGTTHATSGSRDVDWWTFIVPPTLSGVATLSVELNGSAPVGLLLLGRESPPNLAAGEDYCFDRVCALPSPCDSDPACSSDTECLPLSYCESVATRLLLFDSIATSGCQATDGTGGHCEPMVTCVAAPGEYQVVVVPSQAADVDCGLGEGIFSGLACGTQDDYSFSITTTDDCADGACCTFHGDCVDAPLLNEHECHQTGGSFAGEGTTCAALPPDVDCIASAHGCVLAEEISCGSVTMVDLTTMNHPPDEPYPCAASGADPNDSAWFKFTMPVGNGAATSARIRTCDSLTPGRDSIFGVYGTCCPPSGICPSGTVCMPGTDYCGGSCDSGAPMAPIGCGDDGCGFTDFLSTVCVENLLPGETYYVQVSNWAEPVNGVYVLKLDCPCIGSCCDEVNAVCTDDVAQDECLAPMEFDPDQTCSELNLPCGVAACCHPDAACVNTTLADCTANGGNHFWGAGCSSIVCNPHDSCDHETGEIDSPLDQASFGFRSQFAADFGLFLEIADSFMMKGSETNPCLIDSIRYSTFHVSHDTANNCQIGGGVCFDTPEDYFGIIVTISEDMDGPACAPSFPIDPGPDGDFHEGSGCVHSVVFGPAAQGGFDPPYEPTPCENWWEWTADCGGQCEYYNTLHFDPPLQLEKDHRYWLAITTIWRDIAGYSVIWFASTNFDGNFSQSWSSSGSAEFVALIQTPNDQLYEIHGDKIVADCGSCALYGDIGGPGGNGNCVIDIDDVLTALAGFKSPIAFPQADIFPCPVPAAALCECNTDADCLDLYGGLTCTNGQCRCTSSAQCANLPEPSGSCHLGTGKCVLIDVDDILAELDAFSGIYACSAPCPPGACLADFDFNPGTPIECRDHSYFPGGMSETDCFGAGGCYCGNGTSCTDPCLNCP